MEVIFILAQGGVLSSQFSVAARQINDLRGLEAWAATIRIVGLGTFVMCLVVGSGRIVKYNVMSEPGEGIHGYVKT